MTAPRKPAASATMLTVNDDGQRCVGHIIARGKLGHEAFDVSDRSIRIFQAQAQAADAIREVSAVGSP
jgi:hypothetical protein